MDIEEARKIADECVAVIMRSADTRPSIYHYILDDMDLSDAAFEEAHNLLNPPQV